MKEAFLMGVIAMSANADDNDINVKHIVTPVNVTQNGQEMTFYRQDFVYAISAADTKAETGPQVIRHISNPIEK